MANSIVIGENAFDRIGDLLERKKPTSTYILVDSNTRKYCYPIFEALSRVNTKENLIEIPAGEKSKDIQTCINIVTRLFDLNADRRSLLINLGGGMICDIGGFSASVYKRGIEFINIPTTLLSMVDAAVGGKNGINLLDRKNIIGTFTEPAAIYVYPPFIDTLPREEIRSGFAEVVKHTLISNAEKWKELKRQSWDDYNSDKLKELIGESVFFKSEITREDFRDNGRRRILNFGHTIGHGLETASLNTSKPLRHGEAVAAGMVAELYLSHILCSFPKKEMNEAVHFLHTLFNDVVLNTSINKIMPILLSDKKNYGEQIGFSLLKSPGDPDELRFPTPGQISESLSFMLEEFSRTPVHDRN